MTAVSLPAPARWRGLLASEWVKARSVRSTYWTIAVATLIALAVGILLCASYASTYAAQSPAERTLSDPTATSLAGVFFAQLALGTLGVLSITSEYGTGMIRTSMTAVPDRRALLAAKAATFAGISFVVGTALSFASFGIGQALLARDGLGTSLGDPQVLRAVAGGGVYLTVIGLLGVGLGALLRSTPGALTALFGLLFAAILFGTMLPASWTEHAGKYLPANAGSQIMFVVPQQRNMLGPWTGLAVLVLYAAAALGLAAWLVRRRDA